MTLRVLRVAMAAALVFAGWSAGKAQTKVADFEIAIDAPRGSVKVLCHRGCEWARDPGTALQTISVQCDTDRCKTIVNGHGRVMLGMPLQGR